MTIFETTQPNEVTGDLIEVRARCASYIRSIGIIEPGQDPAAIRVTEDLQEKVKTAFTDHIRGLGARS